MQATASGPGAHVGIAAPIAPASRYLATPSTWSDHRTTVNELHLDWQTRGMGDRGASEAGRAAPTCAVARP